MTLITRCPVCTTLFKVAADQLRVSDGWVRCGHCDGVFDASAHLQVTVEDTLPTLMAPPIARPEVPPASSFLTTPAVPAESFRPEMLSLSADAERQLKDQSGLAPAVDSPIRSADTLIKPAALSSFLSMPTADDMPEHARSNFPHVGDKAHPPYAQGSARRQPAPRPRRPVSFVDASQRQAARPRRWVRSVWALALTALFSVLLVQVLLQERDTLAARYPALLPLLQLLCFPGNCPVPAPRAVESVVIDSSSFMQSAPDRYRLHFVLQNKHSTAVDMPALEVTLTGAQGEVLLRQVVLPADFAPTHTALDPAKPFAGVIDLVAPESTAGETSSLPPVTEQPQATSSVPVMSAPAAPPPRQVVTGYRLLVFYP